MDQGFIDILKQLVKEQTNAALTDSRKCKALLADYTKNEYKKESRLLFQAVEAGASKAIEGADDLAACKKAKIRELEEEFHLSQAFAAEAIDALALVLRGDTTKSVTQTVSPLGPPPQTAQESVSPNTIKVSVAFQGGTKDEYANQFADSANEVLKTVSDTNTQCGKMYRKTPASIMDVAVLVKLTGGTEGRVLIEMSKDTALYVAGAMNAEELTDFDDLVKGSIQELANIITGQAKNKLKERGLKIDFDYKKNVLFTDGNMNVAAIWGDMEAVIMPLEIEKKKPQPEPPPKSGGKKIIEVNVILRSTK